MWMKFLCKVTIVLSADQNEQPFTYSRDCRVMCLIGSFFFFQAEDGIRDPLVTGVQTCALPILVSNLAQGARGEGPNIAKALQGNAQLSGVFAQTLPSQLQILHDFDLIFGTLKTRSEERRVGKECRSRWSPSE